jgi:hypothetical protein
MLEIVFKGYFRLFQGSFSFLALVSLVEKDLLFYEILGLILNALKHLKLFVLIIGAIETFL